MPDADLPKVRAQTGVTIHIVSDRGTHLPLQWLSTRQSITADSVGRAEQIACHRAVSESIPLQLDVDAILPDIDQAVHHRVDSSNVINDSKHQEGLPSILLLNRAIGLKVGLLYDLVQNGTITIPHVESPLNRSNCLTKPLPRIAINRERKLAGLHEGEPDQTRDRQGETNDTAPDPPAQSNHTSAQGRSAQGEPRFVRRFITMLALANIAYSHDIPHKQLAGNLTTELPSHSHVSSSNFIVDTSKRSVKPPARSQKPSRGFIIPDRICPKILESDSDKSHGILQPTKIIKIECSQSSNEHKGNSHSQDEVPKIQDISDFVIGKFQKPIDSSINIQNPQSHRTHQPEKIHSCHIQSSISHLNLIYLI